MGNCEWTYDRGQLLSNAVESKAPDISSLCSELHFLTGCFSYNLLLSIFFTVASRTVSGQFPIKFNTMAPDGPYGHAHPAQRRPLRRSNCLHRCNSGDLYCAVAGLFPRVAIGRTRVTFDTTETRPMATPAVAARQG